MTLFKAAAARRAVRAALWKMALPPEHFLAGLAVLLLLTGCNKPSSTSAGGTAGVIKVGEYASLTGKEAGFGQSSHDGTALAVDDLNAAGGIL
ncbi:MAG: ABC transporter substrate-binding protein [Limisphaerales bacterium]